MDLLEIFEKELVSENLFLDLYAILMLRTTSKKYKELIDNKSHKVDVCLKKCDILLNDFSKILKNISDNFIINKLDIQNCIFIDIFNKFDIQNSNPKIYNLKKNNLEQHIKLHNIIKDFCPLLTRLHLGNNLICPYLYYLYSLKRLFPQCEVLYNK
jgi:hypothetical protein